MQHCHTLFQPKTVFVFMVICDLCCLVNISYMVCTMAPGDCVSYLLLPHSREMTVKRLRLWLEINCLVNSISRSVCCHVHVSLSLIAGLVFTLVKAYYYLRLCSSASPLPCAALDCVCVMVNRRPIVLALHPVIINQMHLLQRVRLN